MPRMPAYHALRRSPKKDPSCTFPRALSRPLIHREESLAHKTRATKIPRRRTKGSANAGGPSNDPVATARDMGLCRTCEYRETCTFPGARNGVWGCMEYQ